MSDKEELKIICKNNHINMNATIYCPTCKKSLELQDLIKLTRKECEKEHKKYDNSKTYIVTERGQKKREEAIRKDEREKCKIEIAKLKAKIVMLRCKYEY